MKNVQTILKEKAKNVFGSDVFIAPDIPEKKLNCALTKYGKEMPVESVVLLHDATFLGVGRGMLFSGTKMIWKEPLVDTVVIEYSEIAKAEYSEVERIVEGKDGQKKTVIDKDLLITMNNERVIKISHSSECNAQHLSELLNEIISSDVEYKDTNQVLTLNEMHIDLKLSYLKILVNLTFSNDSMIDSKEYAELLALICRLEFSAEERALLRDYMSNTENQESVTDLMSVIDMHTPNGNEKAIRFSLIKDIIHIHKKTDQNNEGMYPFLEEHKDLFQVGEDEIHLAELAIENDMKMISGELSADEIDKNMKDLGLKAAAIGIPLAAIYMSGSVIGLGVSGIITGLAGLGGILGFTSVLPGIGVAVLLGMGAYTGLKALTGGAQTESQRKREVLLQGVVKSTQRTINLLIEDINYISGELVKAMGISEGQSLQISKLKKMLTLYASAGIELNNKVLSVDTEVQKNRCPAILDIVKLANLTKEPTKAKYYDLALANYEEIKTTDDEEKIVTAYQLKSTLSYQEYESLANIIDAIGYGSMQGNFKDKVSKTKEMFSGFFSEKK